MSTEQTPVDYEVYDRFGPMVLHELVADGTYGDYTFELSRMVPLGLVIKIRKNGTTDTLRTIVVDEYKLCRSITQDAINALDD